MMRTSFIPPDWWAETVLQWFAAHGRHDLPWQQHGTPYTTWLSEIMLQQTQVTTVIPYFERFVRTLPTVIDCANAPTDTILSLWSGLGYYARARNLHQTAQIVAQTYQGIFPNCADKLVALPGIGQSTANAIVAQAYNQPAPILDGNVKRVLSRVHAVDTPYNKPQTIKQLWHDAQTLCPPHSAQAYAQAMMDLGATVCTQKQPACYRCPLQPKCLAYASGEPTQFPPKVQRKRIPTKQAHFYLLTTPRLIALEQRPSSGIWGGLWSLPETKPPGRRQAHNGPYRHTFTHFHLDYEVSHFHFARKPNALEMTWVPRQEALQLGLPAPIRTILESYHENGILPETKKRTART